MKKAALLICLALAACGKASAPTPLKTAARHEHKAPLGGRLVELGEDFAHLELIHNAAAGRTTVYVLDGEAENHVRIADPALLLVLHGGRRVKLSAADNPLTGEKPGDASEFSGSDEAFKGEVDWDAARIESITVRGTRFGNVPLRAAGEEAHEAAHDN